MTNQQNNVGGVDSHSDTIHVAVITGIGQPVADREFPTTVAGYRRAVAWLIERGPLDSVGVEGLLERYNAAVKAGTMQEVPGHPVERESAGAPESGGVATPCGVPAEDPVITENREIVENLIADWRLQAAIDLEKARAIR